MKQDIYKNILVIVIGLLLFYYFLEIKYLLYASIIIGLVSALIYPVAKAVIWLWTKLAFILGWTNSRILLSIVFFVFLVPLAFISRLFTKDPLQLRKKKGSLYLKRAHNYDKTDLENLW